MRLAERRLLISHMTMFSSLPESQEPFFSWSLGIYQPLRIIAAKKRIIAARIFWKFI
jgi:hypothetical protein